MAEILRAGTRIVTREWWSGQIIEHATILEDIQIGASIRPGAFAYPNGQPYSEGGLIPDVLCAILWPEEYRTDHTIAPPATTNAEAA